MFTKLHDRRIPTVNQGETFNRTMCVDRNNITLPRMLTSTGQQSFSFHGLKPDPHQQQCRSNIVECYNVECCFDEVERCFDIVAVFGNNVEPTFDFVAKNGNNVERVLRWNFVFSTKSKLLRQNCSKRQHCRSNRQQRCLFFRQCCFDIVASVDWAWSPSTPATMLKQQATLSKQHSTKLPQNGNIVEATGNEVACFFDNVASTLLLV